MLVKRRNSPATNMAFWLGRQLVIFLDWVFRHREKEVKPLPPGVGRGYLRKLPEHHLKKFEKPGLPYADGSCTRGHGGKEVKPN